MDYYNLKVILQASWAVIQTQTNDKNGAVSEKIDDLSLILYNPFNSADLKYFTAYILSLLSNTNSHCYSCELVFSGQNEHACTCDYRVIKK